MSATLLEEAVLRLFRSILGRDINEAELSARVQRAQSADNEISYLLGLVDELLASEEFSLRYGHNRNPHKVSDSDIFYAYKFLLGRLPENQQVYIEKRRTNNATKLLEGIVASDEFKQNNILKSLISIRRKPKNFEELQVASARNKRNVLVISGCQGKMIADLLQSGGGFDSVESVFLSLAQLKEFIDSKGKSHEPLLSWADTIYTQKNEVHSTLLANEAFAHKSRLMPLAEYVGLQTDQCFLIDSRTGKPIVGPMGEYQSAILAAAYFAGLDVEAAISAFNENVYREFGYKEIAAESQIRFLSQEESTGYPLQEMLDRWNSSGKWMRTINHPKKMVLTDLVKFALEKEGINPAPDFDEYVIDDLTIHADWPQYGGFGSHESGAKSTDFRFKLPKAFTPTANSAAFLTLREFAESFYRSMEGYSLDVVTSHQVGRKVDLQAFVNHLRNEYMPETESESESESE